MKILNVAGALAVPLVMAGGLLAASNEASAGQRDVTTCAEAGLGLLVDGHTSVSLQVAIGDQITITADQGSQVFFDVISPARELAQQVTVSPTVINVTVDAAVTIRSSGDGASGIVTCTPGGTLELDAAALDGVDDSAPSTQDVQRAFTSRQMMSHLGNLYDDVHRNTSGVLNGAANQSISENGLFLQSVGKAAKDIPGAQPALNVFVSAEITSFDGDSFDGLTGDLTVGMDYRVGRDVVVGGLVSAGRADFSTLIGTTVGGLESTGITVGAYAAAKVFGDVTVDGVVTWSGLNYDVANGTTTGDFDANRFGVSIGIYNQYPFMGAILEPHARFTYGHESQDSYTDSTGTAVGETTVNAGRIAFGPRLIAPMQNGFTPWVKVSGSYEFSDAGNLATGAPDFDDTFSGAVGLGFDWDSDLGMIGGEIEFGGLGADTYNSVGGTVTYTLQF